jgi:hypothetical protein
MSINENWIYRHGPFDSRIGHSPFTSDFAKGRPSANSASPTGFQEVIYDLPTPTMETVMPAFSRQALYDQVWETPIRKLAEGFGVSDVG